MSQPLTSKQLADYERDGFLLLRGLFDAEEMAALLSFVKADAELAASAYDRLDAGGARTRLALWNEPGDDLYGMFARSARLVDRAEQLLCDEVYHWHSKMMLKEPRVGGAWEWHQDYGYWYHNGCLFPDLISAMIAVDAANRENGCLQVLVGSHRMGRVDHGRTGEQTGADMERVEAALERFELRYVEAEPGDTLFFHSNLLHRSDQNRSERSRWSLICCYNTRHNDPYKESRHPRYSPLSKVPDSAIKQWQRGATQAE